MNKIKIGRVTTLTALNVLCSNMTQNMVKQLLNSDVDEWENTYKGKCFKKTGISLDEVTIKYINNSIGISGIGLAENINLQALGNKGQGYIENPMYYIGVNETDYKNSRLAIPDLQSMCDVYEVTEDFDTDSKAIMFELDNATVTDNFKMYIVYEDADDETQHTEITTSNCKPFNCDDITLYFQQGVNSIFNDKSEFQWKANLLQEKNIYSVGSVLTDNNTRCNGYKFMNNAYTVNCRVYDTLEKAEINDPKNSINAQEESDGDRERDNETLYLYSTVYRSVTSSRTQAVKVESHRWEFDVQRYNDDGTQIEKWNRGVIGFVNDTNTGHYNLGFMENTATKNLIKIRVDGVEVPKSSFDWVTGLTTYTENTKDVIEDQTYFYWSDISTNMYIFDTLYNAQQAIQGIEDGIVKMFEGDDLTNTHLNDNDLDFNTDMSDCFVLDQADVQALARRFNAYVTSSGDIISDLFVGMAMHENPIDCNIDLFEMPIDVSGFCETEHYVVKFSPRVTPPTPDTGGHPTE